MNNISFNFERKIGAEEIRDPETNKVITKGKQKRGRIHLFKGYTQGVEEKYAIAAKQIPKGAEAKLKWYEYGRYIIHTHGKDVYKININSLVKRLHIPKKELKENLEQDGVTTKADTFEKFIDEKCPEELKPKNKKTEEPETTKSKKESDFQVKPKSNKPELKTSKKEPDTGHKLHAKTKIMPSPAKIKEKKQEKHNPIEKQQLANQKKLEQEKLEAEKQVEAAALKKKQLEDQKFDGIIRNEQNQIRPGTSISAMLAYKVGRFNKNEIQTNLSKLDLPFVKVTQEGDLSIKISKEWAPQAGELNKLLGEAKTLPHPSDKFVTEFVIPFDQIEKFVTETLKMDVSVYRDLVATNEQLKPNIHEGIIAAKQKEQEKIEAEKQKQQELEKKKIEDEKKLKEAEATKIEGPQPVSSRLQQKLQTLDKSLKNAIVETKRCWNFKNKPMEMFERLQFFREKELLQQPEFDPKNAEYTRTLRTLNEYVHAKQPSAVKNLWEKLNRYTPTRPLPDAKNAFIVELNGINAQGGATEGNSDIKLILFKFICESKGITPYTDFMNDEYSIIAIPWENEAEFEKIVDQMIEIAQKDFAQQFLDILKSKNTPVSVNQGSFAQSPHFFTAKYENGSMIIEGAKQNAETALKEYFSEAFKTQKEQWSENKNQLKLTF